MDSLRVGDLILETRDGSLVFRVKGSTVPLAEVVRDDIQVIKQFMRAHLEEHANQRSAFRLDLTELDFRDYERLQMSICTGSEQIPVRPVNFSLTGMLVEAAEFVGSIGQDVVLNMRFDSQAATVRASIIRVGESGRQLALKFPEVYRADGSIEPPVELAAVFQSVEALWLDTNLDLRWIAA
jgi:hypothetical protein